MSEPAGAISPRGGTVSGLGSGLSVALLNNGGNSLIVKANGAFTFATPLASGAAYAVTVGTQPTGQTCSVSNGSGAGVVANISNVTVTCSTNTFTIGGTDYNGFDLGGAEIRVPNNRYLAVDNGTRVTVLKARTAAPWQQVDRVVIPEVIRMGDAAPEVPTVGTPLYFEKTLLAAGESPEAERQDLRIPDPSRNHLEPGAL